MNEVNDRLFHLGHLLEVRESCVSLTSNLLMQIFTIKWPCKSNIYKAIFISSTKSSTKYHCQYPANILIRSSFR
jgi:hypothetical protein